MHLENDFNAVLETIEQRMHHRIKKAVVAAIRDLMRTYREYKEGPREHSDELPRPQADNLAGFSFQEERHTRNKKRNSDPDNYFNR